MEDFDAIADAVMETERGRWFLREFARRNRVADTAEILGALARLEQRLRSGAPEPAVAALPIEPRLARLAALAAEIKAALTAQKPAEQRISRALEGVAALEGAIGASADASDSAAAPLMLAAPVPPAPTPAVEELAITPALEQTMDLVDVAFYEIDRGPTPSADVDAQDIPSAWAWAADERAAAAKPSKTIPEPQPAPPPRTAETLLESLSEAEKAILFA